MILSQANGVCVNRFIFASDLQSPFATLGQVGSLAWPQTKRPSITVCHLASPQLQGGSGHCPFKWGRYPLGVVELKVHHCSQLQGCPYQNLFAPWMTWWYLFISWKRSLQSLRPQANTMEIQKACSHKQLVLFVECWSSHYNFLQSLISEPCAYLRNLKTQHSKPSPFPT